MMAHTMKLSGFVALGLALGGQALAQTGPEPAEAAGSAVSTEAQQVKDADDIALSAQSLRPIVLDHLPAKIDLNAIPGTAVSDTARTLRTLDPADIPGTARTLGGTAHGGLPGAAGSRTTGAHTPSLPSAAQGRSRGRGR